MIYKKSFGYLPKFPDGGTFDLIKIRQQYPEYQNVPDEV